ncbi:MAG TPA: formylmethanofuran dehydrogenase subunit A, partial [Candidatus Nanoarchaeia archaeon]|nr:formylmethanofuran dehydrogenase subunit A [Candidatus Nanoarchaeia archaeon]
TDETVEYDRVKTAFKKAAYTIKGGQIVVKDGEITATPMGRTYWVRTKVDNGGYNRMMDDLKFKFKNYYSVNMANYMVQDEYVQHPVVVETEYAEV